MNCEKTDELRVANAFVRVESAVLSIWFARMPRSIVHVLLSLLLLVSQQMSFVHGLSHWDDLRQAPDRQSLARQVDDRAGGKPAKPALHEVCAQCAAGAQLAFALPAMAYVFVPLERVAGALAAPCGAGIRLLVTCVFQPRGPPRAF
jgi:hypothetical protein